MGSDSGQLLMFSADLSGVSSAINATFIFPITLLTTSASSTNRDPGSLLVSLDSFVQIHTLASSAYCPSVYCQSACDAGCQLLRCQVLFLPGRHSVRRKKEHCAFERSQNELSQNKSVCVPALIAAGSAILAARAQKSSFLESSQQH
jgi:hypothetical protein